MTKIGNIRQLLAIIVKMVDFEVKCWPVAVELQPLYIPAVSYNQTRSRDAYVYNIYKNKFLNFLLHKYVYITSKIKVSDEFVNSYGGFFFLIVK